jgi:SAM-dependent methyltransferase
MTSSDVWDEATAQRYDEISAGMFAPDVLEPAVDFLARLAGSGPALELAIGTGRVAIPLAARGVSVSGIELSQPMVDALRRKVSAEELPVVTGDMASTTVPGQFSLVYVVWNSIGNLCTQEEQVQCFRNAARHLAPGGRFVVELWVPGIRRLPPGQAAVPFEVTDRHSGFDTYDLVTQQGTSHHYWRQGDGSARYGYCNFRYIWPAECDLMARLAGLELEQRVASWDGAPFTSDSESHVSVWRRPTDGVREAGVLRA